MTAARRGEMRSSASRCRRRERNSLMGTADLNSVRPTVSVAERSTGACSCSGSCAWVRQKRDSALGTKRRQRVPLRKRCSQRPSRDAPDRVGTGRGKHESLVELELAWFWLILILDERVRGVHPPGICKDVKGKRLREGAFVKERNKRR